MKGQSRHSKASILIPPSILEKLLRLNGQGFHIGYTAPIYLAGVIEYFLSQVIELSILVNVHSPKRGVRITVNDLESGVRSDKEMSHYFSSYCIYFFESGIVPFIHPEILSKSGRNDKKSIKLITKLQENNRNVFPKRFFDSKCKNYISLMFPEIRFQKSCFSYLQDYIEKWVVDILQYTNILTIYSKKSRVTSTDIELVFSIMEKKCPSFLTEDSSLCEDYMVFSMKPPTPELEKIDE
jgi:histone H3/H4